METSRGGNGLVGHDELGIHHQGPGDADALTLPAENSWGYRPAHLGSTPTWDMTSATRSFTWTAEMDGL